jgi:uncharacterized MAPEG superfamily protein
MTIAMACVLLACLLPIVCAGIAKAGMFGKPRREGGYDNHDPRAWLAKQTGYRARADAAQQNSFEALPLFIAGVLFAQQVGAPQARIDLLAVAWLLLRVGYVALYVTDRQAARSAVWGLAMAVAIAILTAGLW